MRIFKTLALALMLAATLSACKKEEKKVEVPDNGLSEDINDLIPKDVLKILEDLKMPIYSGKTPPNIEGIFHGSKIILFSSNIPADVIGKEFAEVKMRFSNQDNSKLQMEVDFKEFNNSGTLTQDDGLTAFISGQNARFSVFTPDTISMGSEKALAAIIVSGEIADEGIKNMYRAIAMINNDADGNGSGGNFIKNGESRVFYDSDSLSVTSSTYKMMPGASSIASASSQALR